MMPQSSISRERPLDQDSTDFLPIVKGYLTEDNGTLLMIMMLIKTILTYNLRIEC